MGFFFLQILTKCVFRFHELEAQHGELDMLCDVSLAPQDHVNITVHFKGKVNAEQLDLSLTVKDIKIRLASSYVGLPPEQVRIFHNDVEEPEAIKELKNEDKQLHSIPIREGDELHLDIKTQTGMNMHCHSKQHIVKSDSMWNRL